MNITEEIHSHEEAIDEIEVGRRVRRYLAAEDIPRCLRDAAMDTARRALTDPRLTSHVGRLLESYHYFVKNPSWPRFELATVDRDPLWRT